MIETCKEFVRERLLNEHTGHDYWHTMRVYHNALNIAEGEPSADKNLIAIAALLHDVADHKFGFSDKDREEMIQGFLEQFDLDSSWVDKVIFIINHMSFSKQKTQSSNINKSLEFQIVQDADRLDAIGAIGIARAFTYGGAKGRILYNPITKKDTIAHFYEKLLLLKDRMNTDTGKKLALERHTFMEGFLQQFYNEHGEI